VCAALALPYLLWARLFRNTNSDDDTDSVGGGGVNVSEYDVLSSLYNSTGGPDWVKNENWLDPKKPMNTWYGVKIHGGRVRKLILPRNNLRGLSLNFIP
jgi:hypothetical protein